MMKMEKNYKIDLYLKVKVNKLNLHSIFRFILIKNLHLNNIWLITLHHIFIFCSDLDSKVDLPLFC